MLEGDPSAPDCGFAIATEPVEPAFDPCTHGEAVLAEETFVRERGEPRTERRPFSIPEPGGICLLVRNDGVSSARVAMDDIDLLSPDDVNPQVTLVTATATVTPGEHELSVRVVSRPGSELPVEVLFAPFDVTPRGYVEGEAGRVAVWNLFDYPDPFSPSDANGINDESLLSAMAGVLHLPGGPHFSYRLLYTFELADPTECRQIRRLDGELELDPSEHLEGISIAEAWDGRDDAGVLVHDGTYYYRVVLELVRTNPGGVVHVLDSVVSEIQRVTVDNRPPWITLRSLSLLGDDPVVLSSMTPDPFLVEGVVSDARGVASSSFSFGSTTYPIPVEGFFSVPVSMPPVIGSDFVDRLLEVSAVDVAGNEAVVRATLRLLAYHNTRRLVLRFNSDVSQRQVDDVLAELGGRIVHRDLSLRLYGVELSLEAPIREVADELSERREVAYALPDAPLRPAAPNDPFFGDLCVSGLGDVSNVLSPGGQPWFGPCIWHLHNDGEGAIGRTWNCDGPCPFSLTCAEGACGGNNCCVCEADSDCPAGHECIPFTYDTDTLNLCAIRARPDREGDIGWLWMEETSSELNPILFGDPLRVAIIESEGIFQLDHEDLVDSVFTNHLECCGSSLCEDGPDEDRLPDCTRGEVFPDLPCIEDGDCASGHRCLVVPALSRCIRGSLCHRDQPCNSDSDCAEGDICSGSLAMAGYCQTPSRGFDCITDDDCGVEGAGGELLCGSEGACRTLTGLGTCTDGCPGECDVDDDGDGFADESDPEVATLIATLIDNGIDDDGDGVVDEADEADLAAWDDDESGVIDDMHGADLFMGSMAGPLFATTHVDSYVRQSGHMTMVAGTLGATYDNALGVTGAHPNVELVPITADTAEMFPTAGRYAASLGARVVNMSFGGFLVLQDNEVSIDCIRNECRETIALYDDLFTDGMDPNTVYVVSAGNEGHDLDDDLDRFSTGTGKWRFPVHVETKHSLIVAATNIADELCEHWVGCDVTECVIDPGSSYGATVVDVAAPGTHFAMTYGDEEWSDAYRFSRGTSFSAPVTAGVAAILVSRFPEVFLNHPLHTIEHVVASSETLEWEGGFFALNNGRVDIQDAFTSSLPVLDLFEDETFRLDDMQAFNTHDLDFIDADGDGEINFLLEVFGGPFEDQRQPRLYLYDAIERTFHDESSSRLLSDVSGNYSKSVVGDLDGDGCSDIVLAGLFEYDPDPIVEERPLRGTFNRMLLQETTASGGCAGRWSDAPIPSRLAISRDVRLFDLDQDGDLDIYFVNATHEDYHGGDLPDELLVNNPGGAFEEGVFQDLADGLLPDPFPEGDAHRAGVDSCDVNGDSYPDVIIAINLTRGGDRNVLLVNVPDPGAPGGGGRRLEAYPESGVELWLPEATGWFHDVECHDFSDDGRADVLLATRLGQPNVLYVQDESAEGGFVDATESAGLSAFPDTTQEVELCDLDDDGTPEVLFGNGDIWLWTRESNRVLRFDPGSRTFAEASDLGFRFDAVRDLTEDIECADLNRDGTLDAVVVGNTGQRNWLYLRQR